VAALGALPSLVQSIRPSLGEVPNPRISILCVYCNTVVPNTVDTENRAARSSGRGLDECRVVAILRRMCFTKPMLKTVCVTEHVPIHEPPVKTFERAQHRHRSFTPPHGPAPQTHRTMSTVDKHDRDYLLWMTLREQGEQFDAQRRANRPPAAPPRPAPAVSVAGGLALLALIAIAVISFFGSLTH
jgi:hypothetical protein